MKLKIVQAGYTTFTGELGHIDFVDGVSVADVHPDFARSLGTIVQVEEVVAMPEAAAEAEGTEDAGEQ